MLKIKGSKDQRFPMLESVNPEQLEEKINMITTELIDLVGKYKAKRCIWEVKLKENDDPRRPDFYAILARLGVLDMMVADLDHFIHLLSGTPN